MKKLQMLLTVFLISLSILALAVTRVEAAPLSVTVSPVGPLKMNVGQIQVFTASASGGFGLYNYQWYVDTSAQDDQTSSKFNYAPSSAGSYSITVNVTDGLIGESDLSNAVLVTVNPVLLAPTITANPNTINKGQTSSLTSTTVTTGTSPYAYQWLQRAPGAGSYSTINGATSPSYSFVTTSSTTSGSWSFQLRVTDATSTEVTSNAVTVTVSTTLLAPTITANPNTINKGQTSSLTSTTVTTGTSPYAYQWLQRAPGAGSYSTINGATSPSYSFVTTSSTTSGSWSFQLRVTDATSTEVTSSPETVTVTTVPTVVISPTSWIMDVGQSKTFAAIASGGSGSYSSYQWYVGGSAQVGQTSSTFGYAPVSVGLYLITVTVTDGLGATSNQSSPASVTVNASPSVTVSPVGPLKMNVGQIQVFTASASGGSGSLSYQWYLDGAIVSGASNSNYSYTAGGSSHSVYVRVTDSASVPVTSAPSDIVLVTVNPVLLAPTITANPNTINKGQTSSLTSTTVTTGTSPYTYQWLQRAPGGSYIMAGSNSPTYIFVTSIATNIGNWSFILQIRDATGAVVNSSAVTVLVNYPPLDHFIFSSIGTQTAGNLFSITITAKDASNNTLTNYVGTNILNVSTGIISPTTTGVFSNGFWSGLVSVTGAGLDVTLFTTGSGMSGTSSVFTVNSGALDHFIFDNISTQSVGSAFKLTVTAKDSFNNTVTDYVGTPSLTFSGGVIMPATMKAFLGGVGSSMVTVTSAGSGLTIAAVDGTRAGTSNSFTVMLGPTPTPSPTAKPTNSPTPSATPNPTDIPDLLESNITATFESGKTVIFVIKGNITSSQISNVKIVSNQSAPSTTISFLVSGESGTWGLSIMTIPKDAIAYGTKPIVYIDEQQATNQGYTQDDDNFYVWYTVGFSAHTMEIQFIVPSSSQAVFGSGLAIGIIVPEIVLVFTVIAVRRLRRKPENA